MQLGCLGSAASFTNGVRGAAPAENGRKRILEHFGAIQVETASIVVTSNFVFSLCEEN